jgi:hypothetical protein
VTTPSPPPGLSSRGVRNDAREASAPRLGLSREAAARAIDVSLDSFERHVLPELRVVRVGRRVIVPTRELERWLERSASRLLEAEL